MPRPTPLDLALHPLADERFPAVRDALVRDHRDSRDRDAFLLTPEVVQLVRDLRPEDGIGEAIDQLVAFVHHAYLFWDGGRITVAIEPGQLEPILAHRASAPAANGAARYVQLPERRVWGEVVEGEPHEPLDGCFVHEHPDAGIRVLGIFGMHHDRPGFSVVEAAGPRAEHLERPDGSPLYAPTMPGGAAAHLHSIAGGEELLELGWRTRSLAPEGAA
ncbi:MAG TPA: hypothetical protein VFN83_07060 [Gemmatimonadales bacterium]|jgi:hypothetical protein|nr:hypothetical protein [Gemmatimonadales bacterium]